MDIHNCRCICIVKNSDIGGFILFSTHTDHIFIQRCYTCPKLRGQGVFKCMFNHLTTSYPTIRFKLEVYEDNIHAINVYRHLGFCKDQLFIDPYNSRPYITMIYN